MKPLDEIFRKGIRVAALWRGFIAAIVAFVAIAFFVWTIVSRELIGFDYIAWVLSLPAAAVMIVVSDKPHWHGWISRAVAVTYAVVVVFCLVGRWFASYGVDAGVVNEIHNLLMKETLPAHLGICLTAKV